jgi:hypothetical protein
MAISTAVYSGPQWRVAIAKQTTWGTANSTEAQFQELHVTDITLPDFSGILSDETKRSNGKNIMDVTDVFRSNAGSEYTCQATVVLTPPQLTLLLYSVGQNYLSAEVDSDPYLKTWTFDGTPLNNITPTPILTMLFSSAATNENIMLKDVVVRTLSVTCDIGSNGGRATAQITFVTGAMPTYAATATPSTPWISPDVNYYLLQTLATKTLTAGGAADELIISKYEFTIENGATRVGAGTDGNGEGFSFPMYEITGSLDVKYDLNTKDLIDKWFVSPTGGGADSDLVLQHGANSSSYELEMTFHTILTAPPQPANGDKGAFQTVAWRAVTESTTAAAVIKAADKLNRGWISE